MAVEGHCPGCLRRQLDRVKMQWSVHSLLLKSWISHQRRLRISHTNIKNICLMTHTQGLIESKRKSYSIDTYTTSYSTAYLWFYIYFCICYFFLSVRLLKTRLCLGGYFQKENRNLCIDVTNVLQSLIISVHDMYLTCLWPKADFNQLFL